MKKIIDTKKAPSAIGPYSQGTVGSGLIFISGQLPIDPNTGEFVVGNIKEQTKQSLENLRQILNSQGSGLDKVLKTTVFLSDMNNFTDMNNMYKQAFGDGKYPARSAVEVARLPKDALVEIEAIALEY
ncbi:RidA family protein [Clostridium estertheticum]|uniref:RidA family protein n=1 Tax=Clostridium estertheticum TaxID=238834 RepID=UPI001CF354E6|nr:RidA family protein [Clostridium estertheticum]MCB2308703.1 RidA family protein [Clostridium estertheticum]MCB2347432.1 RidA family protein [Clostridium estertheticum]MCB2351744.1 RidA family protein [Clostridium estertheticum]WAG46320.1 RidA family protein [Clostridium estertheticum]